MQVGYHFLSLAQLRLVLLFLADQQLFKLALLITNLLYNHVALRLVYSELLLVLLDLLSVSRFKLVALLILQP